MTRSWLLVSAAFIALAPAQDLTGIWRSDSGGTYQITHRGYEVWWYGRSPDGGRTWQNVFRGERISPEIVKGVWSDLPPGATRNGGTLSLRLDGGNRSFAAVESTGGFKDTGWVRTNEISPAVPNRPRELQGTPNLGNALRAVAPPRPDQQGYYPQSNAASLPEYPFLYGWSLALERVIRRIAGDDGWNQYRQVEVYQLKITKTSAQVVKRMEFVDALLSEAP